MYKFLNFLFFSTIIIAILWGFSDSYSSHSIDNIVHVVAIGIDKCENNTENKMKVSFQFVNMSGEGENSSGRKSSTIVTSINTDTINKAINLMNSYIGKELNFSHCKVIVFSESFAKEGISTEICTLVNNEEFRPSTNIIISTSDANTYLKNANPNIEKLVTNYYDTFELTSNFTGYSDDATIGNFYNNLFSNSSSNTAILGRTFQKSNDSSPDSSNPSSNSSSEKDSSQTTSGTSSGSNTHQYDTGGASLEITGNRGTQNVGIAVFKNSKYIGQLSESESICHLLINNNIDSFVFSIPIENLGTNFDLSISPTHNSKISVDTTTSSPYISVSIFCEAKILTADKNYNYTDTEFLTQISDNTQKYLKQNLETYLNKTSKDLKSDISNFSKFALNNFLTIEDWKNYNWISKYENSNFNINIDLNVTSGLLFSGSQ